MIDNHHQALKKNTHQSRLLYINVVRHHNGKILIIKSQFGMCLSCVKSSSESYTIIIFLYIIIIIFYNYYYIT